MDVIATFVMDVDHSTLIGTAQLVYAPATSTTSGHDDGGAHVHVAV
jgi:hypothetical protein